MVRVKFVFELWMTIAGSGMPLKVEFFYHGVYGHVLED